MQLVVSGSAHTPWSWLSSYRSIMSSPGLLRTTKTTVIIAQPIFNMTEKPKTIFYTLFHSQDRLTYLI